MAMSVYSRALLKAAELLGGRQKLARFLHAPVGDIDKWIADEAKPSLGVFLRVVDLIIEETAPGESSDPGETPPSRDASAANQTQF